MVALQSALAQLLSFPALDDDPIVICTDSQSALASLWDGSAAQTTPLGISIWRSLSRLAKGGRQVNLQWVTSHSGLEGKDRADVIAKELRFLDQTDAAVDVRTIHQAAARQAQTRILQSWPAGWYRRLMCSHLPHLDASCYCLAYAAAGARRVEAVLEPPALLPAETPVLGTTTS